MFYHFKVVVKDVIFIEIFLGKTLYFITKHLLLQPFKHKVYTYPVYDKTICPYIL